MTSCSPAPSVLTDPILPFRTLYESTPVVNYTAPLLQYIVDEVNVSLFPLSY